MSRPRSLSAPVPPGGTIGILGGGQLGRMLAMAAARLGLKTHIFSDEEDAPAFQVSAARTVASYSDAGALQQFASACDVITFEFENVPAETVALLSDRTPANPNARALAVAQERFEEKTFLSGLGIRTAAFAPVSSAAEADAGFAKMGCSRAVLKTRRFGYDGKGQAMVASPAEAANACKTFQGVPLLLESFVEYAFECSVIAARSADGAFAAFDPPLNEHKNHILHRSIIPSPMTGGQVEEAIAIARAIAEALDYVGVLGVELFATAQGELLVNEIAPRVHNSGHWTVDACANSQFEQHIRAIAGWPLGDTSRHSDAVMENIIGDDARDWPSLVARGGALHLYGKSDVRPGRKMGHITWLKEKSGGR